MRVVHLDHSGLPGGGQLGLRRFIGSSSLRHCHSAVFLTPGPVVEAITDSGGVASVVGLETGGLRELIQRRRQVESAIAAIRPDVILANSLRAAVALALTRKHAPWVYYARQDLSPASMGRLRRIVFLLFALPRFDALIANSEWTLSTAPKWLLRRRATAIAPPISGAGPFLGIPREEYANSDMLRLGWLGRIAEWKGLHVLLDAVEILHREGRTVRVQVAGGTFHESEDYAASMANRAARAGYAIEMMGHIDDVPGFLADQDVLVHSSVVPEPFGQVIVQAMAAGLPVVATNAGGPSEIITDGHDGLLVAMGDSALLAQALCKLAKRPAMRVRLGMAARETVRHSYDDTVLASTLENALEKLVSVTLNQ